MTKYDLLIRNGWLVDPGSGREGYFDIGLADGRVARVDNEIADDSAREIYDAEGKYVFPGLVDTHVHLTPAFRAVGFQMLARAGVTCALDCAGLIGDILEGMAIYGSGISVAALNRLDPGVTISGPEADKKELAGFLNKSLEDGAFGFKILGGHLPLTPETIAAAIKVVNEATAYAAFHCGSTVNGSNLHGMLEALELAGNNRMQICHINAYCRGLTHGSPVTETMIALKELAARPWLISESHMGPFNGTFAALEDGVPRSHVTRTCLEKGGYEVSDKGLLAAASDGYMKVQKDSPHGVDYLEPEQGAAYLRECGFMTTVSFPVNRRSTAFLTATEKDEKGEFIVTALSTDGGAIPRNFLLSHGLSLVRFNALTLSEFIYKSSFIPAKMLGLFNKGHLGEGADADLVVADPDSQKALLTVAAGEKIMIDGLVTGKGGTIITTPRGEKSLNKQGVPCFVADLEASLHYKAPEK